MGTKNLVVGLCKLEKGTLDDDGAGNEHENV